MKAKIIGLGKWLPDFIRSNDQWPKEFSERKIVNELTNVTAGTSTDLCDIITLRNVLLEKDDVFLGTKERRVADSGTTAVQAEVLAANKAIEESGVDPKEIELILSWAAVPDRIAPPSAPRVAYEIGAINAAGIGIDVACASALSQMAIAASMIEAGQIKYALLTQSHLMTKTFSWTHPASPNLGDAATAIVVGPSSNHDILVHQVSHGEFYDAVSWKRPRGSSSNWWDAGGAMHLGSYAPQDAMSLIQNTIRIGEKTIREILEKEKLNINDISALISVQPRKWIPGALAEVLGMNPEHAPNTFEKYAHLGGCGPIINLILAREIGMADPGSNIVMYAQGTGFTRASAILRMDSKF